MRGLPSAGIRMGICSSMGGVGVFLSLECCAIARVISVESMPEIAWWLVTNKPLECTQNAEASPTFFIPAGPVKVSRAVASRPRLATSVQERSWGSPRAEIPTLKRGARNTTTINIRGKTR